MANASKASRLQASPISIADITTAVAAVQRARRGRPTLSPEEKAKRRSAAINEAAARFGVSPDSALFRQPVVLALLGVSAATLWRWVKLHPELQPVKLSERIVAWSKGQIEAFMSRMAAA